MVSEYLSSSSASSIPSELETSDREEKQSTSGGGASVNYADEQFESDSDHVHESADRVLVKSSSSSEKYAADEFEDDYEANAPPVSAANLEAESSENYINTEEDDYDSESFEEEVEPGDYEQDKVAIPATHDVCYQDTGEQQQQQQQQSQVSSIDGEMHTMEDQASPPVADASLSPQVGAWCSRMVRELRDRSKNKRRQSQECKTNSVADKIPAAAVNKLTERATKSQGQRRPPRTRNSWQPSCQKLRVSTSLMQRAQTQRWLATSARDDTSNDHETSCAPSRPAHPTSARFCSVKREKLLGQLATLRFSQAIERWAAPESAGFCLETLEFVQSMAARQREIFNTSSKEPGGRMLHRVTEETRLQLQESIALRRQAEVLLEDL